MQQEALRGQALILKQQGDTAAAEQLLADLAQREQGPECMSQHLAQTDYGTLLLEQGNLQVLTCFSDAATATGIEILVIATGKLAEIAARYLHLTELYWVYDQHQGCCHCCQG